MRLPRPSFSCWILLVVTIADWLVADPLPVVDEVVLAALTAACFGSKRKG